MKSTQIVIIALLAILFVHANATTGTLSGSYRKDFYLKDYHESRNHILRQPMVDV